MNIADGKGLCIDYFLRYQIKMQIGIFECIIQVQLILHGDAIENLQWRE